MVRVYGPAMSLDASGTLANTITFSKWKGRNYVRERVIPSNPKSGGQVGRRAMMKFLSQDWTNRSVADKATWETLGDILVASAFNGFISGNMKGWHNFLAPSQAYPAARSDAAATVADIEAAAWEENRIKLTLQNSTANQNWGMLVFASVSTGFSSSVGTMIMAQPLPGTDALVVFWTPPSVATWYFNTRNFSVEGTLAAEGAEFSAAP